jgi:hypothetical protein
MIVCGIVWILTTLASIQTDWQGRCFTIPTSKLILVNTSFFLGF